MTKIKPWHTSFPVLSQSVVPCPYVLHLCSCKGLGQLPILCWGWGREGWQQEGSGALCLWMQLPIEQSLSSKICRRSAAAMLAIGFFSSESYWAPLQSRPLTNTVTPTTQLMGAPVLLPGGFYSSQFCWSPGETKVGPLCITQRN